LTFEKENIIQKKSYEYAIRIVNLFKYLKEEKKEFVLAKQLLRSGTSIGANIEESIGAASRTDFNHKMRLAYKEARETHYWIRILKDTDYINSKQSESLLNDIEEILKIIASILKNLQEQK